MAEEPALTLSGHFHDHPVDSHPERWNSLWEDHKYTPWDRGGPSLALSDILGQRPELFGLPNRTARRALVPGCGRGHDVLLLASFGYDAFGLEVSPAALEEARKNAESAEQSGVLRQQQQQQQQRPGSYNWVSGNFFEDAWTQKAGAEKFDLIFDYTFFCALPPSARPRWARRMVDLLAPGGRLVCLEFPSAKPSSEPGPPWAAPQHAYVAYLGRPGHEPVTDLGRPGHEPVTDLHGGVLEDKVEEPREGGLRRILHQEPQRTHPAGMSDGKMIDRISVWEHF